MNAGQERIVSDILREVEQENKDLSGKVAEYRWERGMLIEEMEEIMKQNQLELQQQEQFLVNHYEEEIDRLKQENFELSLQIPSKQQKILTGVEINPSDSATEIPFENDIYTIEDFAIMQKQKNKGKAKTKRRIFAVRSSPLGETSRQS